VVDNFIDYRCSVYLLYLYKSTNTDAERAAGLYIATRIFKVDTRQKTEIHMPVPVIDFVLGAVVRSADHMSLWPTLRKMPLLRANSDAQQRLVEFLKSNREMDKLVDFYIEIAQFGRAQEICEQEVGSVCRHRHA